ncbi:hypothetical protein E2P81_ATG00072 [Venturia nashicola]|uniref:Uncharacterized protein n=1 Tax=Venturia nashicola TaxID=86259 RepID=A0A4Z1PVV0_9PEZI|nr:hypothetical protein E6O75_ATG00079 [Venturia nashicola]TLD39085.1 hypothetical protein E2P81_ATG00072 [Venturia nashicola]
MLLTNLIALMALVVTQLTSAAIADTTELTITRGDRLSVMPKGFLSAADAPHGDCEYSGIIPGVWYTGQCRTGIHYDPDRNLASKVGLCVVPGLIYPDGSPVDGILCDIRWMGRANDSNQKACANYEDSQFACKHDGDSCQIYHLAEDPTLSVAHCQWPNTILN